MSTSEVASSLDARVLETARAGFGYAQLRPGQAEAIAGVLAGHDTLAVLPTGAGKEVTHASWGAGQVMRYEGETVTVLFESAGYRTLSLEIVQTERLLEPAKLGDARRDVAD